MVSLTRVTVLPPEVFLTSLPAPVVVQKEVVEVSGEWPILLQSVNVLGHPRTVKQTLFRSRQHSFRPLPLKVAPTLPSVCLTA